MKFVDADGEFDVDAYRFAAKVTITAQEILVDNASYPTPRIEENSHKFRPLGLGYANLGALLMSRGLAYDSDEGRNYAAALTAIMHGEAYAQSARHRPRPRRPVRRVREEPRSRSCGSSASTARRPTQIPTDQAVPKDIIQAARAVYDEALELGEANGYRNAQVTVLAPTGTIAFMMDCDTTGDRAGHRPRSSTRSWSARASSRSSTRPSRRRCASSATARSRSTRSSTTSTSTRRSRAPRTSSRSTCRSSTARSSRPTASAPSTTWATSG